MDNDSYLSLTKKGKEVAEKIYEHHTVITEFLVNLGVDKEPPLKVLAKWSTI